MQETVMRISGGVARKGMLKKLKQGARPAVYRALRKIRERLS